MFNSIKGLYTGKSATSIFIETFGIEWEILVSTFTQEKFTEGDEIKVYTWMQHREDVMQLFGFYDLRERLMFLDLMKVDGIGAKQAIKILSSIRVDALETALEEGDIARLQTISGIGKKTAQKMALALKGHLTFTDDALKTFGTQTNKSEYEDVVSALIEMGYERKRCLEVTNKIAQIMKDEGKEPLKNESEFFRRSIVELS